MDYSGQGASPSATKQLPRAIWVDASVLLHDFMHRHPEVAAQRNVVPGQAEALAAYRRRVHAALELLADSGSQVHTTSAVLWRLASVLGEWYLPALIIKIELQYLLSNYHVHEVGTKELEQVLSTMGREPVLGVEELGWQLLGAKQGITSLLTCLPVQEELWNGWQIMKPEHVATAAGY